ncbi:MAG: hypothetical protein WA354_25250 [Terracidiphilus sp.]
MVDSSLPDLTRESQQPNPSLKRRWGIAAFAAMIAMLCTGASSPTGCTTPPPPGNIGPSNAELAGAVIGIGAVIAVAIIVPVEISHSHHNLTGCVVTAANGLELRTSDAKTYSLEGDAASIKAGDKVKIHGSKIKKTKDSTGPGVFRVDQIKRNYGACPVAPTIASAAH